MKQQSEDWFQARRYRLTGSEAGAALGVNPWKTPEDLIRQMVRAHHNAEREFKGNVATNYGTLHEPLAVMDYTIKTGNMVDDCGFFVHPENPWLGATPDGLIDEDGLLEVKAPYGQRSKKPPQFKTVREQEHYYAQMQVELACTGRKWCDFYQWSEHGDALDRVYANPRWWGENFPKLQAFYDRYLSEIPNPAHLEERYKEINTQNAKALLEEYDACKEAADVASSRQKEIMKELVAISKGRNSLLCGRKLTKIERAGAVDYKKVPELKGVNLEQYRKTSSEYWKLS